LIVLGKESLASKQQRDDPSSFRVTLRNLFARFDVDLYLSSQGNTYYERLCSFETSTSLKRDRYINPKGTVYADGGFGTAPLDVLVDKGVTEDEVNIDSNHPGLLGSHYHWDRRRGYGILEFEEVGGFLTMDYTFVEFFSGNTIDRMRISKSSRTQ